MRIHEFHHIYKHRQSIATKPFNARGAKVDRCEYCRVAKQHCLCHLQPDVTSKVSAVLLLSDSEILKPSNTGRLIADVVKDTHVFAWHRTEIDPKLIDLLDNKDYQPILVFPEEYIQEEQHPITLPVQNVSKESAKRPLLVFLDGSWREARRIYRKSPYLKALPFLSLNPESLSQYIMRKASKDNHLSTAEVASLAMKRLGDEYSAKVLELWFDLFRETYLLSKSRLPQSNTQPLIDRYREFVND